MDIENMHPFCLPFGFCHDATSSSIAIDFDPLINNNNNNNNNNNTESSSSATATSDNIHNDFNNKDKIRFNKTSSPSDELFRHLNQTNHHSLTGGHSLLNGGDLIIGSSSVLDHVTCGGDSFYSLELDINIDDVDSSSLVENGTDIDFITAEDGNKNGNDDDEDDLKGDNHHDEILDEDDWFSNQYSLFSPTNGVASGSHLLSDVRRKSLISRALHSSNLSNQVFQHVVDPIDIKSSPTLAQLNLNSNDDPTEGLWGDSSASNSTSTNQIDLLSNCTSITGNRHPQNSPHHHHHHHHHHHPHHHHTQHNTSTNNHHTHHLTCPHQHQPHQHQNNHHHVHHHVPLSSSYQQNNNQTNNDDVAHSSLPCHNIHQQSSGGICGGGKGTCVGDGSCSRFVSSCMQTNVGQCNGHPHFRKPDLHQNLPQTCCSAVAAANLLTTTSTCNLSGASATQSHQHQNLNNGSNLKASTALNQLCHQQQQQHSTINNINNNQQSIIRQQLLTSTATNGVQDVSKQHKLCQQRSASPALVTSSSSPLSSSNGAQNSSNENRAIDNKLKENIEYLTALLCNGNKLDYNHQQPSISSTMVRSYATLAHSLSTGPKLLERQQLNVAQLNVQHQQQLQHQQMLLPQQQHQQQHKPTNQANLCAGPTNEASPCADGSTQQQQQQQLQQQLPGTNNNNNLKRPYGSDQWFKLAVESSVSPADSTGESQVSSLTTNSVGNNNDRLHHHQHHPHHHPHCQPTPTTTTTLGSCPTSDHNIQQQQQQQQPLNNNNQQAQTIDQLRQRSSELKVLSSLLNNPNKCTTPIMPQPQNNGGQLGNWQQQQQQQVPLQQTIIEPIAGQISHPMVPGNNLQQQQQHMNDTQQQSQGHSTAIKQPLQEGCSSIPPNGKPITLTPVAANNGILIQQKPRANLFAQPASPSASSTASSGTSTNASTDTGSSSSTSVSCSPAAKRQRNSIGNGPVSGGVASSSNQKANNNGSNRSARPNSMSTDCSLSSHDEGFSSQIDNDDCNSARDSDDEDDIDSDDESFYGDYTNNDLIGASISDNVENKWTLNMGRTRRNGQKRYFWQYNVQSKGPKGTRICSTDDSEDPFVLPEASDPVFSNDCQVEGVKHSGKARRGDGNDLTPNPRKLLMIGLELKKLGKIINELAPVTDLPASARNKTRKEKNKLASRACRLKKKAQHEANKIKLYGLQREHQQVVMAIYDIRKLLNKTVSDRDNAKELFSTNDSSNQQQQAIDQQQQNNQLPQVASAVNNNGNVSSSVETIAEQCSMKVAGQTSDYVNSVLEKVVSGCIDGGLQT